ncbi:MAG TPA: AraC family transcriptional regulator [Verrucomicrobiota bacterium]|nr:AraC family transcriptional regulator [Verrucomicrobiota bacterium]HPU54900.1 AraC family transcriptional regulator [Verrucomicrobiota bacterium]
MRQKLDLPSALDGQLWYYRNQGRTHARHHHSELELNLIARGTGVYLLGKRKFEIRRGDLLWLFPAQEHVLIEESPDFEMWIAVFKPRAVRRVAVDADARVLRRANPPGEYCRRLPRQSHARLESLFAEIVGAQDRPGFFNAGLAYALLCSWHNFQQSHDVPVHDVHPAVEKAARLIRDNTNRLTLSELARQAGLSPSRLSRLFKQQTGVALVDFRNRQRIETFLELYGAGQRMKLMDAALEAGFGSYPQFHRVFKRVMGCSPGQYRRPA